MKYSCLIRYCASASLASLAVGTIAAEDQALLSAPEIAQIGRENEFWRGLNPNDDVPTNLSRLRDRGANADDLRDFQPKLEKLWVVSLNREWGWLRAEQINAIKEVDRAFVSRVRTARVRAEIGIELDPAHRGESLLAVSAQWQRAILRKLDYDQIGEFQLMNSDCAQKAAIHFENVPLTEDERRTIYELQSEFESANGLGGMKLGVRRIDAQLDHWNRLRGLLGDDRFAVYLAAAEPSFAKMCDALGENIGNPETLGAWWIRQRFFAQQAKGPGPGSTMRQWSERAERELRALIGDADFDRYRTTNDGAWLSSFRVQSESSRPR